MKTLLILASSLALSACATTQGAISTVGNAMCSNAEVLRIAYLTMIQNAAFIQDPVIRSTIINGAQGSILALEECPNGN